MPCGTGLEARARGCGESAYARQDRRGNGIRLIQAQASFGVVVLRCRDDVHIRPAGTTRGTVCLARSTGGAHVLSDFVSGDERVEAPHPHIVFMDVNGSGSCGFAGHPFTLRQAGRAGCGRLGSRDEKHHRPEAPCGITRVVQSRGSC